MIRLVVGLMTIVVASAVVMIVVGASYCVVVVVVVLLLLLGQSVKFVVGCGCMAAYLCCFI